MPGIASRFLPNVLPTLPVVSSGVVSAVHASCWVAIHECVPAPTPEAAPVTPCGQTRREDLHGLLVRSQYPAGDPLNTVALVDKFGRFGRARALVRRLLLSSLSLREQEIGE